MFFKRIWIIGLYLIILTLSFYGITDTSDDAENQWLNNYISLDPSDDLFYDYRLKNYHISPEYVKNLSFHQRIRFFIEGIDAYNLRQNINLLPRYPFVFMPFGGFSYNRGFDFGFLFRADNLANTRLALTTAASYAQNDKLWFLVNLEYPALLANRMKILGSFAAYTSAPQYQSLYYYSDESNFLIKVFNKVWSKLGIQFNDKMESGFTFTGGIDYRIPFIETNTITTVELGYRNDAKYLVNNNPLQEVILDKNNFIFNIREELCWDKFKQTATIPVGNQLSLATQFYLPTTIGTANAEFRFKSRIEEKLNYKLFREFAVKFRLLLACNYNISEDFSGDPYVRGLVDGELTGWFALLSNIELYIPLVDVEMYSGGGVRFQRNAKFVLYWIFFADGGFTLENYDYYLENFNPRPVRNTILNSLNVNDPYGQIYTGHINYLLPAATLGTGIHVYPFFLHFILRFDVGFNIIKAVVYQKEFVEFVFSFNQMF